jgi:hypothetical protein
VQDFEKIIFVLRDGTTRQAKPEEIKDNRIPPDVMEVIFQKSDGTCESFFPSPLGL